MLFGPNKLGGSKNCLMKLKVNKNKLKQNCMKFGNVIHLSYKDQLHNTRNTEVYGCAKLIYVNPPSCILLPSKSVTDFETKPLNLLIYASYFSYGNLDRKDLYLHKFVLPDQIPYLN